MFIKWSDVLAQERHIEEIRQAVDAERQAAQLLDQSDMTTRFYWRWLARLARSGGQPLADPRRNHAAVGLFDRG